MKKLYAIVPARAGSKRVKNKNIIKIKKLMLIDYTINYLLKINKVEKIIISTDIKKIINKYKKKKKILVIQRPKKISGDKSKSSDLVKHVLQVLKKKKINPPKYFFLSQPTSPLRDVSDFNKSFKILLKSKADSIFSACKAEGIFNPEVYYYKKKQSIKPLIKKDYLKKNKYIFRNGAIYIFSTKSFKKKKKIYSNNSKIYLMPMSRSFNLNSLEDLKIIKSLIK